MTKIFHHVMPDGIEIAARRDGPILDAGASCGLFWLGGFKSSMDGTKAEALANLAISTDRPFLRFDYSGHGRSGGKFEEGTISRWLAQARCMFEYHAEGPRVVVGSSMGGWLALLLYRLLGVDAPDNAARIKAIVLIAPAVDMTEELMWNRFSVGIRDEIKATGHYARPSAYDDGPYIITRKLIEDGRNHLMLAEDINAEVPVHILHGEDDPDVPWQHGMKTFQALSGPDVTFTLIKSGDHRLSTPRDLKMLSDVCENLCRYADGTV